MLFRISSRQQHQCNLEYDSIEVYFKKSITIPFLDHLVSDISTRFTIHIKKAALIQKLSYLEILHHPYWWLARYKKQWHFYIDYG